MNKPLRWIFNGLAALSLFLLAATLAIWLSGAYSIGSRVLCIATPWSTFYRIRLDNPIYGHITQISGWPGPIPHHFSIKYVADPTQGPFRFAGVPLIILSPPKMMAFHDDISLLSGRGFLAPPANLAPWDAIVIQINFPTRPAAATNPAAMNLSVRMMSFSYDWVIEIFAVLPMIRIAIFVVQQRLRRKRPRPGYCATCGYDLRTTPDRCPECGQIPHTTGGESANE